MNEDEFVKSRQTEGEPTVSDSPKDSVPEKEVLHGKIAERPWRPQDADKEVIRQAIRSRVRNASVPENAIFIPANPKPTIDDSGEKRVAVYARVSTKSTEQVSSIENQTRYYTEKIDETPNWTLQSIYSDEGKSGVSTKKRKAFLSMLEDAAQQKMDLILCASVSRFARNVSTCIEEVTRLKTMNPKHPIGVYFETEGIFTLDPDSSQLFSVHALLADWESENKSRRMILSYDQRIRMGQYPLADLLGYRHTENGTLEIVEEEAKTVRFIFLAYLCGYTGKEIAEILTEKGRTTLLGNTKWNEKQVRAIIDNERRWGDLHARKTTVIDYRKSKSVKNDKLRDSAYIPKHHEAIVSPAIAKAAHYSIASTGFGSDSMPNISVIRHGNLKGFVSVCPGWSAVDNNTFLTICKGAYSNKEQEALEHEMRIRSGEEHTNVIQMGFLGYEVPPGIYFMNANTPALTISRKGISFNTASHKRLNNADYVEILYHPILQMIAVRVCENYEGNAICWVKDDGKPMTELSARAFSTAIYDRMDWIKNYRFKFRGFTKERGNEKILLFYLDEPQIIVGKNPVTPAATAADEQINYIPYKNSDVIKEMPESDGTIAYPNSWKANRIGMSYELRKTRDRLADSLTAADISEQGVIVINPLVGDILPSRKEVINELEQLLLSM